MDERSTYPIHRLKNIDFTLIISYFRLRFVHARPFRSAYQFRLLIPKPTQAECVDSRSQRVRKTRLVFLMQFLVKSFVFL